jgi:hypothetical protein
LVQPGLEPSPKPALVPSKAEDLAGFSELFGNMDDRPRLGRLDISGDRLEPGVAKVALFLLFPLRLLLDAEVVERHQGGRLSLVLGQQLGAKFIWSTGFAHVFVLSTSALARRDFS